MKTKKTVEECENWKPRNTFTDEEKIKAFDSLRKMAVTWHRNLLANGSEERRNDMEHYIFEEVLESTLGKEVWDYTNPLC